MSEDTKGKKIIGDSIDKKYNGEMKEKEQKDKQWSTKKNDNANPREKTRVEPSYSGREAVPALCVAPLVLLLYLSVMYRLNKMNLTFDMKQFDFNIFEYSS